MDYLVGDKSSIVILKAPGISSQLEIKPVHSKEVVKNLPNSIFLKSLPALGGVGLGIGIMGDIIPVILGCIISLILFLTGNKK